MPQALRSTPRSAQQSLTAAVAEEIRAWQGRRRVSGVRLAAAIGKSQPYVSLRLSGKRPWNLNELEIIAETLGVDITMLCRAPDSEVTPVRDEGEDSSAVIFSSPTAIGRTGS